MRAPPRPPRPSTVSRTRARRRPRRGSCNDRAEPPARSSSERLEDQSGTAIDVASAESQDAVARTRAAGEKTGAVLDARHPTHFDPRPRVGQSVDDELPRHTLEWLLPRAIDVGDGDDVGRRQRVAELGREVARAGVEVGLKEDEDPAAVPNGGDVGGELSWMVRVTVEDLGAARLTTALQPAAHATELAQDGRGLFPRVAGQLERGQRDRGVPAVVLARHGELDLGWVEVLSAHGLRRPPEPVREQRLDLDARGELGVVVEVDVRDYRDLRAERGDRPVRLVSLDDQPARAGACVAAELRDLAADQERRVVGEAIEAEGDHRGGRRFAVRTRDHDRALQRDELGEKLGTRPAFDLLAIRGRDDDLVPTLGHDRLRRDLDDDVVEPLQIRSLDTVPTADVGPPSPREQRIPGEPRAADADEPDSPALKRWQALPAPPRSRQRPRDGRR